MHNKAAECRVLVNHILRYQYGPGYSVHKITTDDKKISASTLWGVSLWACKQTPGIQLVDILDVGLTDFLLYLATKGVRDDGGSFEYGEFYDGVTYWFADA